MNATEFGLIGHPLAHSLSPFIHRSLLAAAGLEGEYRLIDLQPESLRDALPGLKRDLAGFNCTIPFKEAVIPYLENLDPTARLLRSVNTIWQNTGYNTDYPAFIAECPDMSGHQVLILGAGGVSRTMAFAAAAAGASVWIQARRPEQSGALAAAVRAAFPACRIRTVAGLPDFLAAGPFDLPDAGPWGLLNGTPVGLWPNTAGLPFPPELITHFSWVYDTIYNPLATRLTLAARSRGTAARNGLGMLFAQAVAAERIWHPGLVIPERDLSAIRRQLGRAVMENFPLTLVLTGFMGSGKSTVGQTLADRLGLPLVDLDQAVVSAAGRSIPDIFASGGEPAFRALERQQLSLILQTGRSQILATGGGALLDPAAEAIVRRAPALVIFLDTPLAVIRERVGSGSGRPLLQDQGDEQLFSLYTQRQPRYLALADLKVSGAGQPEEIAAAIAAGLGYEGEQI